MLGALCIVHSALLCGVHCAWCCVGNKEAFLYVAIRNLLYVAIRNLLPKALEIAPENFGKNVMVSYSPY